MTKGKWYFVGGAIIAICAFVIYYFGVATVADESSSGNQTVVVTNQSWKVNFSNPIKEKLITDETVQVRNSDGKKIPISYKLSNDQKQLQIFLPDIEKERKEEYTLYLSSAITSKWGIPIIGGKELHYTVLPSLPTIQSKQQLEKYFTALHEERYGFFGSGVVSETSEDKSASKDNSVSKTNTQVAGIDEGDIVKTDGDFIYTISNQDLYISSVKPANKMKVVSNISFAKDFYPIEILLQNGRLIVIGESATPQTFTDDIEENGLRKVNFESKKIASRSYTQLFIYDITDKENPKQIKHIGVEGSYQTSRMKGSYVYVIANQYANMWTRKDHQKADFVPKLFDNEKGVYDQKLSNIRYIPNSKESSFLHTVALDVSSNKLPYKVETLLGSSDSVYMSDQSLYVATTKYWDEEKDEMNPNTEIYKFDINKIAITFHAMGEVNGDVLNQFSMDEHKGYFRIATTQRNFSSNQDQTSNHLYILDENMKTVGKVGDLAKGERIYSARFMGDKAYIVTFREIDPLFVIDTSNPVKPKVLGELKIPGFSTYLHPYDENHLIGYGYNTKMKKDINGEEFVTEDGMKISLFDVSDFSNPKEKDSVVIGGMGTQSELLYDHKALYQNKEKNLFGFPISVYKEDNNGTVEDSFQGAMLYEITPQKGIILKNKMASNTKNTWDSGIKRILNVDDTLYTISNQEVKAFEMKSFANVGAVSFNKNPQ
ncbi:beta-propeller domain-containing protein [Bacillus sp. JJ722]|uniref:beta-propeller domain-containing protein n=1 Tax=Bacillus sp. JJ722 TaxID=3122973 RepID=UPI002FFD7568